MTGDTTTGHVFGAVDIGASGGRVMAGTVTPDGRVELEAVHRFANGAAVRDGHLRWDFPALAEEVLVGLTLLARRHPDVVSIGIDTWAVDYGLLDADGHLLAEPVAYRDDRTDAVIDAVHATVPPADLYAVNGLQHLPFTTVYQLAAEQRGPLWARARHAVLVPDLLAHLLTGELRTEITNASTTGLLDVRRRAFSTSLPAALDLPADLFPPLVEPGTTIGRLRPEVLARTGLSPDVEVVAVGSHDTASAVVGMPATGRDVAYVSSGTWSLVGIELDDPVLTEDARAANFTNEGGVDGRIRFLRNVGGLWLLQESLRTWRERGEPADQDALLDAAAALPPGGPTVDVDDPRFIAPGDMPDRIRRACAERGSPVPETAAAVVRTVLDSLAVAYARTVRQASELSGRPVEVIHIVGGGSRNTLLCQLTADLSGLPVVSGPVEATALGNVLVQARAAGALSGDLDALRAALATHLDLHTYRPAPSRRTPMPQWHAAMIAPDQEFDGAPLLRTETALDPGHGDVTRARLHLSAFGIAEAWINGEPVSAELLTPGWSSYEWRLRYRTVDVTDLVGPSLVLGVALGNGWFRGRLGWHGNSRFYGDELAAWAQLEITFADGHQQVVATGPGTWRAGPGPVLANDLYDGQTVDARRRDDRWLRPGFDDASWTGVHALEFDVARLTPYVGPPVTRQQEIAPARVWASPSGATLVDFGQNLVGFVKVRVRGEAGTTVTLRHAEVLEHDELGIRPLRTALATDRFVLSGGDDEFEPTFTFHGFRYAEVSGWPGELAPGALTAVVIGSDLRRTGTFACSNPLVNQLHSNVVWGMRGNFVDVPTDCPQRDERLGWTGDLAVFAPSATYLYDAQDFLRDWLLDLAAEQRHHDGMIPFVVPDVLKYEEMPEGFPQAETTAIWSDAGVWVPWALWQAYGDDTVLRDQFDSMAAHTRRVRSLLSPNGLWDQGFQFGDWLDPQAPPDEPFKARADTGVVATACAYRTAVITAEAARVLGRSDAAAEFDTLAEALRSAFNDHYVEKGIVHSDCATVYALAIAFGLLDDDDLRLAGDRLAALVVENGHRVSTGFAGTPFITDALTVTGHLDEAYGLLLEEGCPSWLYPVTMGATTVWERWDSMLPDGTINSGEMTSFNHYALGAVADWLHRTVAGLAPLEPGYRTILVEPRPGGGLTWAEATLESPRGPVAVRWEIRGGELHVDVTVPEGATAVVRLPDGTEQTVAAGTHHLVGTC